MKFRLSLLVLALTSIFSTYSYAQRAPASEAECVDILYTKGGRVINCRIDAVFASDIYFSISKSSVYTDKFLPSDSLRAIWPMTNASRSLFKDRATFPVETTAPPAEYRNQAAAAAASKGKVHVVVEGVLAYSHMLGRNEGGNAANLVEELRDAPQYTFRFGVVGRTGLGAYGWYDTRSANASDNQFDITYSYTNVGVGIITLSPLSRKKDVGYFTGQFGLGYGGVDVDVKQTGYKEVSASGSGLVWDLALGVSFTIGKYAQLGLDGGLQTGTAQIDLGTTTVKEGLNRLRFGLKAGFVF